MSYVSQSFSFQEVLASSKMNQVEENIRNHIHGASGVAKVPASGLDLTGQSIVSTLIGGAGIIVDANPAPGAFGAATLHSTISIDDAKSFGTIAGYFRFAPNADASKYYRQWGQQDILAGGGGSDVNFSGDYGSATKYMFVPSIDGTAGIASVTQFGNKAHVTITGAATAHLWWLTEGYL